MSGVFFLPTKEGDPCPDDDVRGMEGHDLLHPRSKPLVSVESTSQGAPAPDAVTTSRRKRSARLNSECMLRQKPRDRLPEQRSSIHLQRRSSDQHRFLRSPPFCIESRCRVQQSGPREAHR